jgi:cyanate permease
MTASKDQNKYRTLMVAFSFSIAFLLHLLLFATAPMVTIIMDEMELSYAQFGFIFSVTMITLAVFRLPWGLIADRIGYLRVFKIASPFCLVFAFARAWSSGYTSLLISQFFLGIGLAVVMPVLTLLVKEWAYNKTGLSTGIYIAGFAAGNATALGLTPYLLKSLDWRTVLLCYAIFCAVICLLWWIFAKSTCKGASTFQIKGFSRLLRDRYVWVLLFFLIATMGSYDSLATWMPKVLAMKQFNTALATLLPLGFFLAGPIIGSLSDRFKDKRNLLALLGIGAAASIIGLNYAPFPILLLCLFLSGFTITGVLTITLAMPVEHERLSPYAGSVVGLISSLGNIGPLIMPVIFGLLIDVTGTYYASIFAVAALAGITFTLGSRIKS